MKFYKVLWFHASTFKPSQIKLLGKIRRHFKLPTKKNLTRYLKSMQTHAKFKVIPESVATAPTFSSNFDFEAQLYHEIFQISNPNFSHVIYN
jgi:hypothetical protein